MGEFSLSHLMVLGIIVLIFFRKDQLPSLGKSIGKAIRGFKEGLSEIDVNAKDIHDDVKRQIPNQQNSHSGTHANNEAPRSADSPVENKAEKSKQEN